MDKLIQRLRSQSLTIATVESFTGGLLSDAFVQVPGISDVFVQGIILYHPQTKQTWLGLSAQKFSRLGMVSVALIDQLLKRAIDLKMGSIILATTGNAGPSVQGKSNVGEVVLGVGNGQHKLIEPYTFTGNRHQIRLQGVNATLALLERFISTYY